MAPQRSGEAGWKTATVLLRTDILARALEDGIDISAECNRALADRLGIDYRQQELPAGRTVRPVIVAKNPSGSGEAAGPHAKAAPIRPVLNAEDPATPSRLKKMKKEPAARPEPVIQAAGAETGAKEQKEPAAPHAQEPAAGRSPKKETKKPSQKTGKDDRIRQFITKKILRTESAGGAADRIAKDEMYRLFVRWCRAKPGIAVPDKRAFSIALKNRFVLEDVTLEGVGYWNNVRLR